MKAVAALLVILGAFIAGMAIVTNAPPYVENFVRGLLGVAFAGAFAIVLRGPFGQAIAGQLREGAAAIEGPLLSQLDEVIAELRGMREDLIQIQDRIDFTERMLAQQADARKIGSSSREGP